MPEISPSEAHAPGTIRLGIAQELAHGHVTERRVCELAKTEVLIGRGEAADLPLPHGAVSLIHARIQWARGKYWIVDAGSKNGTFVDGQRLPLRRPQALSEHAKIRIGPFELSLDPPPAAAAEVSTAEIARKLALDLLAGAGEQHDPSLEVVSSEQRGVRAVLHPGRLPVFVGRAAECAICLSDCDVSRLHVRIERHGDAVTLYDLGSKNGVAVNGTRVTGERRLIDGDKVTIGRAELIFSDPAAQYLNRVMDPTPSDAAEAMPAASVPPVVQPADERDGQADSDGPRAARDSDRLEHAEQSVAQPEVSRASPARAKELAQEPAKRKRGALEIVVFVVVACAILGALTGIALLLVG